MRRESSVIVVRGGGDIVTGTVHRLRMAGYRVLVLETAHPAAIRRQVAFCEAVYDGSAVVEGVRARLTGNRSDPEAIWREGDVPVRIDPEGKSIGEMKPDVVVDAILAKRNLGTHRGMAPCTIALGPGFCAGIDADYVIETMRGHDLGRIITKGCTLANTDTPGMVGGYAAERVIHAKTAGILRNVRGIGDAVTIGTEIAYIQTETENIPVRAAIPGIIRGLIRDGYPVTAGFKIADIDPRKEELKNCFTISDKARCIAGSVLEIICGAERR